MAEGFRVTGALAWVSLQEDEECFLAHSHPSYRAHTAPLTHHPAAHCISMATSRPGPWMLEMRARGREEREGEIERRNNIKILRKIAS